MIWLLRRTSHYLDLDLVIPVVLGALTVAAVGGLMVRVFTLVSGVG